MNRKRIARGFFFYILGLVLGSYLVYEFWIKKRTDLPSMWPEGKVKEKINESVFLWDSIPACYQSCYTLDSTLIHNFVANGNVRFGISKTRKKPHPVYVIDGKLDEKRKVRMQIESADSTSRILQIEDLPDTETSVSCNCPTFQ